MKQCPKCEFQTDEAGMVNQVKRKVFFKSLKITTITQGWGEPPGPSAQVDLNFHEGKPKGMEIQNCESPCIVVFLFI